MSRQLRSNSREPAGAADNMPETKRTKSKRPKTSAQVPQTALPAINESQPAPVATMHDPCRAVCKPIVLLANDAQQIILSLSLETETAIDERVAELADTDGPLYAEMFMRYQLFQRKLHELTDTRFISPSVYWGHACKVNVAMAQDNIRFQHELALFSPPLIKANLARLVLDLLMPDTPRKDFLDDLASSFPSFFTELSQPELFDLALLIQSQLAIAESLETDSEVDWSRHASYILDAPRYAYFFEEGGLPEELQAKALDWSKHTTAIIESSQLDDTELAWSNFSRTLCSWALHQAEQMTAGLINLDDFVRDYTSIAQSQSVVPLRPHMLTADDSAALQLLARKPTLMDRQDNAQRVQFTQDVLSQVTQEDALQEALAGEDLGQEQAQQPLQDVQSTTPVPKTGRKRARSTAPPPTEIQGEPAPSGYTQAKMQGQIVALRNNEDRQQQVRRPWTQQETDALLWYIAHYGTKWARILKVDAEQNHYLDGRNQVALKDKARNIVFDMLKSDLPLPENLEEYSLTKQYRDRLVRAGKGDRLMARPGQTEEGE